MSENVLQTIEGDEVIVEIVHDPDVESPREWHETISTFAFFHRHHKNESDIKIEGYFESMEEFKAHMEITLD